jgi:flagellar hook-associated protein 3 FlgL
MRITTFWMNQSGLNSLRKASAALARAQQEATTGKRVGTVSDDPLDAGQIMQLDGQLRDIDRYRRNGTWGTTRMSTEDTVLTSVRSLAEKAKRIAVSTASLPVTDPARIEAVAQIQQLKDQIISLGNTKVGQEYLFSGSRSTHPAFLPGGMYMGDGTVRQVEIDNGMMVDTTDTGAIFVPALAAIDRVEQQLQTGTTEDISAAIGQLADANTGILQAQTALGSRMAEISDMATQLATRASKTADRRDSLQNVDSATAAVNLTSAQTALQQAYAVVAKVLSINIMDYLK